MNEIEVSSVPVSRLAPFIGSERTRELGSTLRSAALLLRGRRLVNVTGDDRKKGGVFEILRSCLPYVRGAGIDVQWLTVPTAPQHRRALEFFHVLAHGVQPSREWSDELTERRRELQAFADRASAETVAQFRKRDVVIFHDTQTAPIVGAELLRPWRPSVFWHAHIGTTDRNEMVDRYWEALAPSIAAAAGCVFYRPEYAPSGLGSRMIISPPAIDPAAAKNAGHHKLDARELLRRDPSLPVRWLTSCPALTEAVGLQLSRWDLLKDMPGAVRVFARVAREAPSFSGMVVGPRAQSSAERHELGETLAAHASLEMEVRARIHVGVIGAAGTSQHDRTVGLLQSAADLVMQRSRREGFGLTVTEAMYRSKPVVAAAVGGIPLQIEHDANGLLVRADAGDDEWARTVLTLMTDDPRRKRLAVAAGRTARERHLVDRQLVGLAKALTLRGSTRADNGRRADELD